MAKSSKLGKRTVRQQVVDVMQMIFYKTPLLPFEYKYIINTIEKRFLHLGVELTNICNANCSFCPYRYATRKKMVISDQIFKKVIRDYSLIGGGRLSFTPTVGDPLVDKKIIDKIEYCRQFKNIRPMFFFTNGILLHKHNIDKLLTSGINTILISTFLGDRESYKRYYGVDTYDLVIKNIFMIIEKNREMGFPVEIKLHLRCEKPYDKVVNSNTFKNIAKIISKNNIYFLNEYDRWGGDLSMEIKEEDLPKGGVFVINHFLGFIQKEPCFELYRRIHILPDGNVGVCMCKDINAEIVIGNVNEDDLLSIWNGNKIKEYREKWLNGVIPNICNNCSRYLPISEYIKRNRLNVWRYFIKKMTILKSNDVDKF